MKGEYLGRRKRNSENIKKKKKKKEVKTQFREGSGTRAAAGCLRI